MLSPFVFAALVDFVIEFARQIVLSELLYINDFSEAIEGLRNKFFK